MRAVKSLVVAACLLLPGCKKDKPEAPAPTPATGSATTMAGSSGSAATDTGSAAATMPGSGGSAAVETAGSGQLQDVGSAVDPTAMSHHAQHCPSMVRGSTTTAKLAGKSVVVTITSDDKVVASKVQARTDKLLKDKAAISADQPATAGHAQNGSHGGGIGICPVHVPQGATAKSASVPNGVAVTITPKSGADELLKDVEARIGRAADWVKNNPAGDGDGTGNGGGNGNGNGSGDAHHGHRKHT
jgi:hypothetical protein